MFEFQIDGFVSLNEFESGLDINPGARPVVMFLGDIFESNSKYRRIKNLLNDFWVANIEFSGIDPVDEISYQIVYSCEQEGIIEQRIYRIHFN